MTGLAGGWALRTQRVPWRKLSGALVPASIYVGAVLVSWAASVDPAGGVDAARALLSMGTLFFGLVLLRDEGWVRRVIDGLVLVSAGVATHGLAQLLFGFGGLENRIRGPFSHYMTFAGVLLLADMILLAQIICGRAARSWWRWAAFAVINAGLVLSLTRSAWVALALTFAVLLLLRTPRLLLLYSASAALALTFLPFPLVDRAASIVDLRDTSNYDRICMAEAGLHMISDRPALGLGPGMVAARYPIYRHATAPRVWVPHLHNNALQISAENGLVALGAYGWLMIGTMVFAYRRYRRAEREGTGQADLYMGSFLAVLAFNLAGIFEFNWGDTEVQRVLLCLMAIPYRLASPNGEAA